MYFFIDDLFTIEVYGISKNGIKSDWGLIKQGLLLNKIFAQLVFLIYVKAVSALCYENIDAIQYANDALVCIFDKSLQRAQN